MDYNAGYRLRLFSGRSWIKVQSTLLADGLLLTPLQNSIEFSELWNQNLCKNKIGKEESEVVCIAKGETCGLGVSIKGGREFGTPVIISKVFKGMAADQSKQLKVGDVILSVNGENMRMASHNEAVKALKKAGPNICLEIRPLRRIASFVSKLRLQSKCLPSPPGFTFPTTTMTSISTASGPSQKRIQIPLSLAYVARRRHRPGSGEECAIDDEAPCCCIEIFSPDLTQSCLFCAGSHQLASVWFKSLSRHISILNQLHLQQIMRVLPHFQFRKIGWVLELDKLIDDDSDSCLTDLDNPFQIPSTCASSEITWQPVFLVVTDRLLLVFSQAPQSPSEWSLPSVSVALIATRVVVEPSLSTNKESPASLGHMPHFEQTSLCFTVRTGRRCGVESHTFAAPTSSELKSWLEAVTQSTEEALDAMPQLTITCRWRGLDALLVLHRFVGIYLFRAVALTTAQIPQFLWYFPFEHVSSTADDGKCRLWITFNRDLVQELELPGGAKPVVFVLLNILSMKLLDINNFG
uniref:Beta 1 syntrophin n=1 Tax=Echinococcus granulosus TaxID=6210 RepID=A0A068WZG2_ECHGR|nr:beta 1 syntrophin [Echinococcus granulosus]